NNDAVEDVAFPADVVVYPSVVKDVINVLIASPKDEEFTVEVVNANGQTVKTVETGEVQSTLVQIHASNLTQGVYNVRVKAGDQMKVIKVVK
ncbi:MAG: T9SS type A sorting domain-containing protein, partial [Bacteroidales bacterium]|nr:T9SS type A sorting domain-containing protein [Bacteroidales bacterium]